MKKAILGMVTLAAVFTLAACGGGNKSNTSGGGDTDTVDVSKMPIKVENEKKIKKGGELKGAVAMDTQFKGLFYPEFSQDQYDQYFMYPVNEELFDFDSNFTIEDGGAANLKLDKDAKTATITLRDDLKWSDGKPVTADDIIFTYEVIGNKDYTGIRYDASFSRVLGMDEYNKGQADTISGLKKDSDTQVTISYKDVDPGMLQQAGVWPTVLPKHAFEGIAVKDMESSDVVRKHPIHFGPYVMDNIVEGQSVTYKPNEYYYGGKPNLDKITFKVVGLDSVVKSIESKEYDFIYGMPTDNFPSYKDADGYTILARPQMSYTYLGFKMGKWDKEQKRVVTDPNAKMSDKALRQAMGYAIDNDAIGKKFYNGLRTNASTLIPPVFSDFHDDKAKGYTLDLDKANKLLDDAGYKDTNDDGIREDKNGKKLTIKFASMSGGETAQPIADYYRDQWKEIGLDVEYTTGRLIDFQAFYDKVENDDPEIDVYMAAWSLDGNPSPTSLYGPTAPFNYSRFSSEENDKLMAAIDSQESFDEAYRKKAFAAWQEYAVDQAFVIPTLYRNEVLPLSNRVAGFDWNQDSVSKQWPTIGLTE